MRRGGPIGGMGCGILARDLVIRAIRAFWHSGRAGGRPQVEIKRFGVWRDAGGAGSTRSAGNVRRSGWDRWDRWDRWSRGEFEQVFEAVENLVAMAAAHLALGGLELIGGDAVRSLAGRATGLHHDERAALGR